MSTREAEVRALINKMAKAEVHSSICKCPMCMRGDKIPFTERSRHEEGLKSTMVDRKNPDNPTRSLMKATEAHAILYAGTKVDMRRETGIALGASRTKAPALMDPRELTIKATWKNRHEEQAVSGRNASVFGALGVLLIPQNVSFVDIPKMDARAVPERFLDKYGAKLVSLDTPVELEDVEDPSLKALYLVQYDFDSSYIEEYVMKKMGGGGLFVETHPFPHVFTPLAEHCGGALILGTDNHDGTMSFAAFQIPFGYTMKINSDVIHGDSFFTGPYAIALTETELADSVLFRQDNPDRDIQLVIQTPTTGISLPLLAEHRLAKAVNHAILIESIMRTGAAHERKEFFLTLPAPVLSAVKGVSPEAEDAYKERASWIDSTVDVVDEAEPKFQYHCFFKAPKPRPVITDTPTDAPTPTSVDGNKLM